MSPEPQEGIAVGRITGVHGVRGEVAVLVLSEVDDRFAPGSVLRAENHGDVTVERTRPHRGRLLVKFQELPDRNAAEELRGRYLFVDRSSVPDLPAGSFWPHELEGSEVLTQDGRSLGRITEIVQGEANDIWVARDGEREVLIPALRDVVRDVDPVARRVVIAEVPGLTTD